MGKRFILDSEKSEEKPQLENMESKPATAPTETPAAASNAPPVAPETSEEKGSGNPIEGKYFLWFLGDKTYLEFSHASNGFNGRCG